MSPPPQRRGFGFGFVFLRCGELDEEWYFSILSPSKRFGWFSTSFHAWHCARMIPLYLYLLSDLGDFFIYFGTG